MKWVDYWTLADSPDDAIDRAIVGLGLMLVKELAPGRAPSDVVSSLISRVEGLLRDMAPGDNET